MFRKFLTVSLVALLAVGMLAAFSGAQEKVTLTWATRLAPAEEAFIKSEILPDFEAATVKMVTVAPEDMRGALAAQVPGGIEPGEIDVIAQDNFMLYSLWDEGLVADLTDFAAGMDPAIPEDLLVKFEGKVHFMPYRPNVQVTFYKKDALEAVGVTEAPQGIGDYYTVCKALQKDGEGQCVFKFYGGIVTPTAIWEWIVAAGGDPLCFNDAGNITVYALLQRMWEEGLFDKASTTAKWDTTNDIIARCDADLGQNWPFAFGVLKDLGVPEENIGVGYGLPTFFREAHVIGGEVLGVVEGTPRQDLAEEFITFMESKDVQKKLAGDPLGWPTIREDALPAASTPLFEAIVHNITHGGVYRPNLPNIMDFFDKINEAVDRIILKGENVRAVLDELRSKAGEQGLYAEAKYACP